MGRPLKDLTGQVINGIKFLSVAYKATGSPTKWLLLCHCGEEFVTTASRIKTGKTKSCGCERYHYSFIKNRYTYSSYSAMIARCTDPKHKAYPAYGGNGIVVCDEWLPKGKKGYLKFVEDMGERPKGTSINRIGSVKRYSKETCEWAPFTMQSFDQRTRHDSPGPISGVVYRKDRNKWVASITVEGEAIGLYYGDTESEAIEARKQAELKYFGRFKS
ncbi:HNH endonuclease [Escherichia phage vB_EcoM_005]|uniref:Uncharacterized protein n=1 Tax=Escherichia phage vB_EcoM_005 TaxID=2500761 RepID=A0A3Q9R9Z6_9CAUD|nr:HNH endonuclease [Escherichia phage vB_EcoM_005]AZV00996.1 hypothetical protein vBEcoM005_109 [Escherichia phage vB_EcoM_005]